MSNNDIEIGQEADGKVIRLLYIVLFYVIYGLSEVLLALITIVQSVMNLFSDGPSRTLIEFGQSLALYVSQIVSYLSYASEQKPFPFDDWPSPTSTTEQSK
ncbi:MAG: DUF4389 domain-containing protein [Oleiphilaceae bacterium]|nr:DUF4389 domain-containing protein [Oleiphilaceae bacterium]